MPVPKHWMAMIPNNTFALAEQIGQGNFRVSLRKATNFFVFMNFRSYLLQFGGNCGMMGGSFDKKHPNDSNQS